MMHRKQAPALPAGSPRGRLPLRASVALLGLIALAGCSRGVGEGLFSGPAAAPASAPASTDPVVIFAGQAAPGTSQRIALPDGQTAQVRVVRAYNAASGRECRELLVGSGMVERSRLVCAVPGGWVEARPLLRGGGAARP
ncbi:DVU3141 family protein [Falsiroseomonas tokyonensis]|uniref:DVU3141 family protein n=1 Tax=Falsiroseomonas tokyonensis TaxID=430521 RepID=A0ABV7C481_9PROT|nr:DVU3141 family protein [Falsiroseomonas tokyonensis]MBU8541226.1 hypothetical protein [Falsiroseomonas tokyonensis]